MKFCGISCVLVSINLIFYSHVLAEEITTELTDALDVGIGTYEQKWPWECENILQTLDGVENANAVGKILCDKKVEMATLEENYKGQLKTQAIVCENQKQATQTQEKLMVANYELKIKHLQLEKALILQNCDLKMELNSVNTTVVYQDCQQRLQACENKAAATRDCGNRSTSLKDEASTSSEVEALLNPKLQLDLITLSTGSYYISDEKENWYAASKLCKLGGMELVNIESKEENEAILEAIGDSNDDFWLSGTDLGTEGHFYWASTGQPFGQFSDWMSKMPDNFRNNEHCVQFHSARGRDCLKWNDNNCNKACRFICELLQ